MSKAPSDLDGSSRTVTVPYGRHWIEEDDIEAVVEVLRSDWLTTGPQVAVFEKAFAQETLAEHAVAVSSGTAALHAAMYALEIGPGDEVIVPAITFASTANCVVFQGGKPVFADVDSDTLLIDPDVVESKIGPATKAVIAVDYAGQPCEYDRLRAITERHGLALVADACHSLGGRYKTSPVGSLANLNVFSLHPVKHITTGEGGVITTDDPEPARRMRIFRNHGITTDHRQRQERNSWRYEMVDLGYNYRITDFQCALGISQLRKLKTWICRRQLIARRYDDVFSAVPGLAPLVVRPHVSHAYHLYVVRLDTKELGKDRDEVFTELRNRGVGANVHYAPVHLHPYYREKLGTGLGMCPVAETVYEEILSLPVFPRMADEEMDHVTDSLLDIVDR